jgi:integrase
MTGSLQQKNNRWQMVIELGGKNNTIWLSTRLPIKDNQRRAEKMLKSTLAELDALLSSVPLSGDGEKAALIQEWVSIKREDIKGKKNVADHMLTELQDKIERKASGPPLGDFEMEPLIKEYLEEKRISGIRANSLTSYQDTADVHVIPYFKKLGLTASQITPAHIKEYFSKKKAAGLSASTLAKHRTILRGALTHAIQKPDSMIIVNVADNVKVEKAYKPRIPKYYDPMQLKKLFNMMQGESIEAPVVLAATYGFRRSEVLGLKWNAIDFKRGTISVQHTVVRNGKETIKDNTVKERASFRTMPLTDDARAFLLRLKEHQKEMQADCGKSYVKNDYICKWDDGSEFDPNYISHRFRDFLKYHRLPHIRFHDLRHSSATLLINEGFTLEQVKGWLGHASIRSTEIYAHLKSDDKNDMAQTVNDMLTKKRKPPHQKRPDNSQKTDPATLER